MSSYSPSVARLALAAADASIVLGGTPDAPTVKVGKALDHTYTTDFVAAVVANAPGGAALASKVFTPGANYTIVNTLVGTDVDAANLITPAFVVPASGAYIVVLSALGSDSAAGANVHWGPRVGAADVAPYQLMQAAAGPPTYRTTGVFPVTGRVAGANEQVKFGWKTDGNVTGTIFSGTPVAIVVLPA